MLTPGGLVWARRIHGFIDIMHFDLRGKEAAHTAFPEQARESRYTAGTTVSLD